MTTGLFFTQQEAMGLSEPQLLQCLYTDVLVIEDRWADLGKRQRQGVTSEMRLIIRELQRRGTQLRMC